MIGKDYAFFVFILVVTIPVTLGFHATGFM